MNDIEKEDENLGTLADFIAYPELYSCHVDEDLDWVIEKKKPAVESVEMEKVIELQNEIKQLRQGIRRILEVKRLWSSVVNPNHQGILNEVFAIAKQILE